MKKKQLKIIDCTLRDGLYVVDQQLTVENFEEVMVNLDDAGLEYIEIGHGLGFGGNRHGRSGPFVESEVYALPEKLLKRAKWGTFFIGEKLNDDEISTLASIKMDFLKIGVLPNKVDEIESRYSGHFKLHGDVFLFLMQSDKWTENSLKKICRYCQSVGYSGIYCVDSTGCMLPVDIERFANIVRSIDDKLMLGFHGHDNLGLAVSNSIYAQSIGFDFIDTTCLGIGRSAGNCSTEQFLALQEKQGRTTGIDLKKLFEFSSGALTNFMKPNAKSAIDILTGLKGIHSFDLDAMDNEELITHIYEK